jgi:hypothetical protein
VESRDRSEALAGTRRSKTLSGKEGIKRGEAEADRNQATGGEEAMRRRECLRLAAIVVNGVFVLWLFMVKAWWMPIGFLGGLPFVVPPTIALIALALSGWERY